MSGIIGYIGKSKAAPILFEGLKRLEYRGYDSAGICTISNNKTLIEKDIGKLEEIEKKLGRDALNNMHIHISGIEYSEKGERNHLNLRDSDLNFKELVRAWKAFKVKGVVISESPNIERDALMLKRLM